MSYPAAEDPLALLAYVETAPRGAPLTPHEREVLSLRYACYETPGGLLAGHPKAAGSRKRRLRRTRRATARFKRYMRVLAALRAHRRRSGYSRLPAIKAPRHRDDGSGCLHVDGCGGPERCSRRLNAMTHPF